MLRDIEYDMTLRITFKMEFSVNSRIDDDEDFLS